MIADPINLKYFEGQCIEQIQNIRQKMLDNLRSTIGGPLPRVVCPLCHKRAKVKITTHLPTGGKSPYSVTEFKCSGCSNRFKLKDRFAWEA